MGGGFWKKQVYHMCAAKKKKKSGMYVQCIRIAEEINNKVPGGDCSLDMVHARQTQSPL